MATTPLLSLLNELLVPYHDGNRRQQEQAIRSAIDEINVMVGGALPQYSAPLTSQELVHVVTKLLHSHTEQCRIPSAIEGSLPLHFAASLGDVNIASILLENVSFVFLSILAETRKPLTPLSCTVSRSGLCSQL